MLVHEVYGLRAKKGQIGLEIECEGQNLYPIEGPIWKSEHDGSLREGIEYVLKVPVNADTIENCVKTLIEFCKEQGTKLSFTHRTSVHVHVNVSEMDIYDLKKFVYVSYFLDVIFSRIGEREIKGNRFALRLSDAYGALQHISYFLNNSVVPNENDAKYSSVNICPINKYGSVEFRSMHGNMNPERIGNWCKLLWGVREQSKSFKSMKEIFDMVCNAPDKFLEKLIPKEILEYFWYDQIIQDVQTNLSLLAGFHLIKEKK